MVERNQLITVPFHDRTNVVSELDVVRSDEIECLEGHLSEADDGVWRDDFNRLAQVWRAVANLARGRRCVASSCISWVTEHGIGNEYLFAGQTSSLQQQSEVASRLILREWNAAAVSTQATGRFGDEKDLCMQVSVGGTQHAPSPLHSLAEATHLHLFDQLREGFVCFHKHIVL